MTANQYQVKKVNGFINESSEYTGAKATTWQVNRYVSGYALMIKNVVIEVYPRKSIAQKAADALNA